MNIHQQVKAIVAAASMAAILASAPLSAQVLNGGAGGALGGAAGGTLGWRGEQRRWKCGRYAWRQRGWIDRQSPHY